MIKRFRSIASFGSSFYYRPFVRSFVRDLCKINQMVVYLSVALTTTTRTRRRDDEVVFAHFFSPQSFVRQRCFYLSFSVLVLLPLLSFGSCFFSMKLSLFLSE